MERDINMKYIDTVFSLRLEISSVAVLIIYQVPIINFSNPCKQFQRLKRSPNLCLHKGNALKTLITKNVLYIFLCFFFSVFLHVVATIKNVFLAENGLNGVNP